MADALASGASVLRDVGVQVPLRPQSAVPRTGGVEVTNSKEGVTFGVWWGCATVHVAGPGSIYTPPVSPAQNDTDVSRRLRKLALDSEINSCRRCDGMNIDRVTASAPGYGCLSSPVALVGQSLCEKCMESKIPFTGGSG